MAYIFSKGVVGSLVGNGWRSVSFGLLLAVAGLGGYSLALKRGNASPPRQVVEQLKEVNKQAVVVERAVHRTTTKARKSTERINHVLEVHKKWSDQPVPSDVVDELCRKITCSEDTSKVSAPNSEPTHRGRARTGD